MEPSFTRVRSFSPFKISLCSSRISTTRVAEALDMVPITSIMVSIIRDISTCMA